MPILVQTIQKFCKTKKNLSVVMLKKIEKLFTKVKGLKNKVIPLKKITRKLLSQPFTQKKLEKTKKKIIATKLILLFNTNQALLPKSAKVKKASQVKNKNFFILNLS